MASIRKRGDSYLLVVSMGYDYNGNRRKPQQKTVHPPRELTPKQKEKWLEEQAVLFELECKNGSRQVDKSITLGKYVEIWLQDIAPNKLAKSTPASVASSPMPWRAATLTTIPHGAPSNTAAKRKRRS